MRHILVLGGSGFVGSALCDALARDPQLAGARLRVPSRRAQRAGAVRMLPNVDLIQADIHQDAALDALLKGCDAVVNLVAILHGSAAAFEQVHVGLPRRLAAAMARQAVRRLVHVSALGVPEGAPASAPSAYLRSKAAGEQVLREAALAQGLQLTMLRPSVIFGVHDKFLNLFAALQALFPLMPLAGAEARFQPVWVGDVAQAVVASLRQPQSAGQTLECAGPDVFTLRQLVELTGQLSGHPRTVLPLPSALAQLQALVMECLPGEPLMSRDNLASMTVPNIATPGRPGLAALGLGPTALMAVAPAYLRHHQGCARLEAWRALHR
ncbi:MAG: complex I NDUFA9 subunit family protein [Ideonella sp.]|nr:complex I NDUFA9 subunit family protein [Ideonella sp.]